MLTVAARRVYNFFSLDSGQIRKCMHTEEEEKDYKYIFVEYERATSRQRAGKPCGSKFGS
jgi:hypothetical protein